MKLKELISYLEKLDKGKYTKEINNNKYDILVENNTKSYKTIIIKKDNKLLYEIKINRVIESDCKIKIYFEDYTLESSNYSKDLDNLFINYKEWAISKYYMSNGLLNFEINDNNFYKKTDSINSLIYGPNLLYNLKDNNIYILFRKYNAGLSKNNEENCIKIKYTKENIDSLILFNEILKRMKRTTSIKITNIVKSNELIELFNTYDVPLLKTDYKEEVKELLKYVKIYTENINKLNNVNVDDSLDNIIFIVKGIIENPEYIELHELKKYIEENDLGDPLVQHEIKTRLNKIKRYKTTTKKLTLDS